MKFSMVRVSTGHLWLSAVLVLNGNHSFNLLHAKQCGQSCEGIGVSPVLYGNGFTIGSRGRAALKREILALSREGSSMVSGEIPSILYSPGSVEMTKGLLMKGLSALGMVMSGSKCSVLL
ncbi:hypothetical protein BDR06DRAFT_968016 [Suillus hirtellus]|nr:hypothetical protein BDR06DRAFT_968016 [Suillus hirtellus]